MVNIYRTMQIPLIALEDFFNRLFENLGDLEGKGQ